APLPDARRYVTRRRVQHYELDSERHVNNAVYLNWVEQAFWDACAAAGVPLPGEPIGDGRRLVVRRHELAYRQPAVAGDEIEIASRLHRIAPGRHTWLHEVRRATDDALLVRALAVHDCLDDHRRPAPFPEAYRRALAG
ncbi:MAG: acyl-CoA thioesterase, partial [Caldilineae bacterium]